MYTDIMPPHRIYFEILFIYYFFLKISANPMIFCSVLPTDKLMHPTRCGQFYDCTRPNSRFGEMYLQECPYPSLYDPNTKACLDFTEVTCGVRAEPISPCTYTVDEPIDCTRP